MSEYADLEELQNIRNKRKRLVSEATDQIIAENYDAFRISEIIGLTVNEIIELHQKIVYNMQSRQTTLL